ncbi:hypothetical protein K431DRAFT_44145 [Polychaeton citri CBS 116435]|uniref:Uncharacterized protein n=1 Tax=Polychaeton citri CBS 116435 TaxID=1314669 RepID=A0A9P4QCI3_9PEZI|nr:hypothetical protein K431DRAFT_44145 [Polychaeton citri CBS 116435]
MRPHHSRVSSTPWQKSSHHLTGCMNFGLCRAAACPARADGSPCLLTNRRQDYSKLCLAEYKRITPTYKGAVSCLGNSRLGHLGRCCLRETLQAEPYPQRLFREFALNAVNRGVHKSVGLSTRDSTSTGEENSYDGELRDSGILENGPLSR